MTETLNTYPTDSPEWQLFENMRGSELAAQAFQADSERALAKAAALRAKADRFRRALDALSSIQKQ